MSGKPHKLQFKKLVKLCQKEFKELKIEFSFLTEEEKVIKILSIILHKIYERNFRNLDSLKFSDYLKEEPYLDYHFFKICKEIEFNGTVLDKNLRRRPFKKKFGIFDVDKLEKKRKKT